ncbi:GumC family protein [Roseospira navarrensis]|nr:Wzz/FepE/Etk N-terminal domain-containing protein [Roseospira navarrensis]
MHETPAPAEGRRRRTDEGPGGAARQARTDDALDLMAILRMLWRRRAIILGTIVVFMVLATLMLVQVSPRYTATALLTLEARQESVIDIEAVMSGLSPDASVINTELDVLQSGRLLGKLVDARNLTDDPEFNSALRPPNPIVQYLDPRTYIPPEWLTALGLSPEAGPVLSEAEQRARQRNRVIDAVGAALSVSNPDRSYTIRVSFETGSPDKSAALANTLADLYLTDQLEAKFEAIERATRWLGTRIGDLRQRVREAEVAVQRFREENQIIQASERVTVSEQQLAELNSQLITAQNDLTAAEARYAQVRDLADRGAISALGAVLDSALVQRLREQEAQIQQRRAEISNRYGERHPEVSKVNAELQDIRGKIAVEVNRIVAGMGNEVQVARGRVKALETRLDALKATSSNVEAARVELRELEREAESSRVLLENFLSRSKETASQEGLQQADARIISEAKPPAAPSYPKKKLVLAVVLVLASAVGVGLAILLEALDRGYRSLDHVQRDTGVTGLGMVPRLPRGKLRGKAPFDYVVRSPTSAYAEALRSAFNTLTYGRTPPPRTVLVTSSLPGEGKTTLGLCLARLLARAGDRRVLFIEADLRRGRVWPTLSGRAKAKRDEDRAPTLDAYLSGAEARWQACVITDEVSNLDLILGSGQGRDVQTLLRSDRMAHLVEAAREQYNLVLIDSPPVLAVSDAIVLSRLADTTVLVVQWAAMARDGVKSAVAMLDKADVEIGGAVMTQVDLRKHSRYGYGDYASYYGQYGHYYAN